jgi:hypothetical protein
MNTYGKKVRDMQHTDRELFSKITNNRSENNN